MLEQEENEELSQDSSECSKDSDCDKGYVCVRGRCVPDLSEEEID